MLTHKERMLAAIRGQPTDQMPWAPRLDLWYNAQKRAGTLPSRYRKATLMEITDDLGWGFHAVVPDFRDLRDPEDDVHRGLGVWNLWMMPCRTVFEDVDCTVERDGDETRVEYRTPVGSIRTRVIHDESMRRAGITISHLSERAIKSHEDYEAIGYIFEHARVVPNFARYQAFADQVGDRGLAVARLSGGGSPLHLMHHELMSPILLFYETYDHPQELQRCADRIGTYFERLLDLAVRSPAQVLFLGGNYEAAMTPPPFFRKHILPWLKRGAERSHGAGKFLVTHTDGENEGLLDLYLEAGVDIADSVCPKPMTRLSLKEVRDCFDGRITIMGGIPSVSLLTDSMSDMEFEVFLDEFFDALDAGDHLILGVSDTTPPAARFDRLQKIYQRVQQFGPITPPVRR